ncbi:MAG: iron-sulfur cluster-binding oxidoreductase [Geobacteraceae bacterium]|nr:iron-sulfur cluster-binding oxidoreductase [Geobacteraceae bacterium]
MRKLTVARVSQLLFLLLFLFLFVLTEYRGKDEISFAVNSFFRGNPLVLAAYVLAAKSFTWLLLPAVLVLFSTLLLGRFFCGWICPLGTLLDLAAKRIRKTAPVRYFKGNFKYWLLFPLLSASLFNINLAGIFDPIAVLTRALTFFFYPLLGDTIRQGWVGLYGIMGDKRDVLAPAYGIVRDYLLPFRETFYPLAFMSALFLLVILFLERYETRNWCRNICPLGTLLGLAGRFSLFKRIPDRLCPDCQACGQLCPTAFDREILQQQDCIRCMECSLKCTFSRAAFRFAPLAADRQPYFPERRIFIGSLLSGFLLVRLFRFRTPDAQARLLRPPGVRDEEEFLKTCVRCGECMKVCLKNALYPAVLNAGAAGVFTPVMIPRLGYCEYNCTLCGQVCPTGAIPNLPPQQKRMEVIGKAVLDKNRCLPFAKKTNCIVCEEHCPIPKKAIRFEEVMEADMSGKQVSLKKPYVVDELCNGCGICEYICPVDGKAGIEITATGERTPLENGYFQGAEP